MSELEPAESEDRCRQELKRLFYLYRLVNLNARYYGCRAEQYAKRSRGIQIVIAFCSAVALSLALATEDLIARHVAATASGFAGVLVGVSPFLGWTEKISEMRNLKFGYSQLFGQVELVIAEIRRANTLTDEHLGMSRMVHDTCSRLHALDELQPDQKIIDREDAKVREAFPDDYIWTRF